jgi:Ca2+-binding RTX toxin-like protein
MSPIYTISDYNMIKIDGTIGADTIAFTSANTWVEALGGANTITGTTGDNYITSGMGADTITVTTGHNTIDAGGGANTITATIGNNHITTGDGADTISVTTGLNRINAGSGANTITATIGNNHITAGDGADTITTSGSTGGTNTVHAGNGANTVTTGAGNDIVTSGHGADTITTAAGDDTITIKGGIDTIAAGAGNDTLIADLSLATGAVSLSALAGTAAAGYAGNISGLGVATFAGVENFEITSGVFNDTITTGDGTDVVHAGGGDDIVNLAGGDDEAIYTMSANETSEGSRALDVYQGGEGHDTLTLVFTKEEWDNLDKQQIKNYKQHLNDGKSDDPFNFNFGLEVSEFEALNVIVKGSAVADAYRAEFTNFLTNGSFEDGAPDGTWNRTAVRDLPGWEATNGFRVWRDGTQDIKASDGKFFLELDKSNNNKKIDAYSSTLTTQDGQPYTLEFDLAKVGGTNDGTNQVELFVNDAFRGVFKPIKTEFNTFSVTFDGTGSDTIKFQEPVGKSNGKGGLIDNVRVVGNNPFATGNVLDNDTDGFEILSVHAIDGQSTNASMTAEGLYGSVQIDANGKFIYLQENLDATSPDFGSPNEPIKVFDVFIYTVVDDFGATDTATVSIEITGTSIGDFLNM